MSIAFANAQTFTYNGINYKVTDATNFFVEVGNNTSFIGAANIPTMVVYNSQNYTVTKIGVRAFSGASLLTSVIIPNSVITIADEAFYQCSDLTSLDIPNSVTTIGSGAFLTCSFTSVVIPNSVTTIGEAAFYGCSDLTTITLPNTITTIQRSTFQGCYQLTSITIPNSVNTIGENAFKDCTSLTSINIPNSVNSIGNYAFYRCNNLTSVAIPNGITTIQQGTFQFCNSLASIIIPNSVTTIGNDAFRFNTSLNNLIIPNSVTSIGSFAFGSNYSLVNVTLPNSITSIGYGAFAYLYSLNSFTVNWQEPLDISSLFLFDGTNINSATLNVPVGTASLYEAAPVWTEFNIVAGPDPAPRGCWASVSNGSQHTLAIAQDGTLWAWGDNSYGQLGNNLATGIVTNPLQISNEPNWAFVSAGEFYSLAIKKNGTLWVWGRNTNGQLGNGNTTQQNVPVQIGVDTDWVGVYAGFSHSMAKKANNTLWAWGRNTDGQLGINSTAVQQTPTQVGGAVNWKKASLGRNHTVALTNNGELWVWGSNTFGQLGLGNYTNQLSPIRLGNETWKAVEAGDYHNIAIKSNNTLYSWGDNFSGQLGLGDTTERNSPAQIGTATDWETISAGLYNSYAIKITGALWACGDNFKGQIGNGNFAQQNNLIQVGTATDWYDVFAGNEYAVAQKTSGTFYSWGDNQSGQLGNGSTLPNTTGQNTPGTMGCAGNILAFDGLDDRVIIPNNGTGILGDNTANESYTIEMKVKLNTVASNKLFSKNTATQGFTIGTDASGNLFFDQSYGGVFSRTQTTTPITINTWYRVVTTFDYATKTHKLYLNGILIESKTETATPEFSSADSGLGYSYGEGSGKFDGDFNDLRIWNIARTPIEVSSYTRNSQSQTSASNLLVHFKFNQGIANVNNAGLTTLANEVLGGPVGTLQNFALTGSNSNWAEDVSANETLNNNNFLKTDDLLVYPNPSNGIFNIDLKEEASIEIYDMLGKAVYVNKMQGGKSTIDISNYQSGLYFLNIKSENGLITKKLLKQ